MILDELANYARERVKIAQQLVPCNQMKEMAMHLPKGEFLFEKALQEQKPAVICEVKKASPSKGIIAEDFPYLEIAKEYEAIGATCISVLTEPKWFLGSDEIFRKIREAVSIPMIRKDFTVDAYQIYEAKVMGADAVLLICALLDTETIKSYLEICDTLGMTALVETHNLEEIKSAVLAGARVLGVNNRNLKDFTVNLDHASNLKQFVPEGIVFVAESGIITVEDGKSLLANGADALLIGEALMRSNEKYLFVKELKSYGTDNE